jgi:hypothetical protein
LQNFGSNKSEGTGLNGAASNGLIGWMSVGTTNDNEQKKCLNRKNDS